MLFKKPSTFTHPRLNEFVAFEVPSPLCTWFPVVRGIASPDGVSFLTLFKFEQEAAFGRLPQTVRERLVKNLFHWKLGGQNPGVPGWLAPWLASFCAYLHGQATGGTLRNANGQPGSGLGGKKPVPHPRHVFPTPSGNRATDWLGIPVDLCFCTSGFQTEVLRKLREIKPGETTSYQKLAQMVGRPDAFRAVGQAVGRNPVSILVPCHRVLRADGALSGFAFGLEVKTALLRLEGARLPVVTRSKPKKTGEKADTVAQSGADGRADQMNRAGWEGNLGTL